VFLTAHRLITFSAGSYGAVYECEDVSSGSRVAVKEISNLSTDNETGIPVTTLREIMCLSLMKHSPNVNTLRSVFIEKQHVYLVMELGEQTLSDVISDGKLTLCQKITMSKSLIRSIYQIHDNGIMHRDLKPDNILVGSDYTCCLIDFGLAKVSNPSNPDLDHCLYCLVQTLWYRSPEVLLEKKTHASTIDVWSVGCIIAEIFLGEPLFEGNTQVDCILKIFHCLGTPRNLASYGFCCDVPWPKFKRPSQFCHGRLDDICPKSIIDILEKMLVIDPRKRITIDKLHAIVQHL
jgi:serine/threonine protein kinase